MNILILVVKGFIIGIGKVIPGISGAMLAISLGLYEKCLEAITHFFKNIKDNIILLGSLGIGVLLAIVLGSKIIAFLLVKYYLPVILLFLGLIIGGIIPFYKNITMYQKSISKIIVFIVCLVLVLLLSIVKSSNPTFTLSKTPVLYFIMGIIDATTMVIPGISGTAVFMVLGLYENLLNMFASIDSITNIIDNLNSLVPFALGVIFGVLVISVLMNYLFKKKKEITEYGILGFQLSAVVIMFFQTFTRNYGILEIVTGLILFLAGIKSAKYLE